MKIRRSKVISEINVTPMVDVMLVLLVVFMITAPMLVPGIEINVPIVQSGSVNNLENIEVVLNITKNGSIYINDTQVNLRDLKGKILQKSDDSGIRLFIRGDRSAPYERIVKVLAYLKESGFKHIALVTENRKI
ncbi:biopolymer transport ExbD/TolR family protein [Neorickettsia helminthoeca str. Oregon]|uniref:Biopolymer transport ExbD/TolR family protein n=1 Tax=Neorickettsia helminthoeca str. Oregon TaxID=1286528 RepID=X5GXL2_9RICK|nr:biopolymer transporter ExbD [Neorickettsia helminthoeca]AHX11802.1 biopolymer transport ExbD/TolR family protein [Neorickettsia helminthoeca str. Oregon]